jgi:tryptophan synthase alpha chain
MTFQDKTFMPFFTLGDYTKETSIQLIKAAIKGGAQALELGFAFTDPVADGPAVQEANNRSLKNNITTNESFSIIKEIRKESSIPISIMVCANLVNKYKIKEFYQTCKELKIDAVLIPDAPTEELEPYKTEAKNNNIYQIQLVTTNMKQERLKKICRESTGYIYLVSHLGTTGEKTTLNQNIKETIDLCKQYTKTPIYLGFGISKPEHFTQATQLGANGVIVGSAICNRIAKHKETPQLLTIITEYCQTFTKT